MKRLNPIAAKSLNRPACNPNLWLLDPKITFLNHGSFGACPRTVLKFQHELRARLEPITASPVTPISAFGVVSLSLIPSLR